MYGGQTNWQYNIIVTENDKKNLKAFFNQEYAIFVTLNNALMSKLKRDPSLLTIFENKERLDLFATLVQYKINKINISSEHISRFKNIIEEKTITGTPVINESVKILFETAAASGEIHQQIRYNMAYQLMQFYCDQALIASQPSPNADQLHKLAYQFIETPDETQKRHIQIPRRFVKIEWDETTRQSSLYTPYTREAIVVPKNDLTKNKHWNYMIIHQRPGKMPNSQTPWQIDIRKTSDRYLINYMEISNPFIR